ncbi:MAG: Fe-S cluster assembly protein SufD [Nitriliruptor sp.]|nr:MAG: Fe-S cluster assembly protein SufD [Nitriliruptor sp.]
MTTLTTLTEEALTGASDAAAEPTWLRDRRLAAYKRTLDLAWPDSRADEFWRSTPFAQRLDVERDIVAGGGSDSPASFTADLDVEVAMARIVDGALVEVTVPRAMVAQGVLVADLSTAAAEHAAVVEPALGSLTSSNAEGTAADADRTITVNDAAWTAGVFIHVPAEVELDAPIVIQIHAETGGAHLPRVLAVLGHHARASVYLEHTSGADTDALVDEVVEVIAHDAAQLDVVSFQQWGSHVDHLALQKVQAHRDSRIRHLSVTVGGRTVRFLPETDLIGPGAETRPLGLYFADEGQWFDLQPYVRHLAPRATSDVLFKGALQGHSRTVFRGNIFVHKDAVGTDTDENNKSLILTEGARADATPFLEIECSDIVAGHGSATGQIDALQLYYLTSRGIPREEALRLIVTGFFREVFSGVDLPGVEEAALTEIDERIAAADLSRFQVNDASLKDHHDE